MQQLEGDFQRLKDRKKSLRGSDVEAMINKANANETLIKNFQQQQNEINIAKTRSEASQTVLTDGWGERNFADIISRPTIARKDSPLPDSAVILATELPQQTYKTFSSEIEKSIGNEQVVKECQRIIDIQENQAFKKEHKLTDDEMCVLVLATGEVVNDLQINLLAGNTRETDKLAPLHAALGKAIGKLPMQTEAVHTLYIEDYDDYINYYKKNVGKNIKITPASFTIIIDEGMLADLIHNIKSEDDKILFTYQPGSGKKLQLKLDADQDTKDFMVLKHKSNLRVASAVSEEVPDENAIDKDEMTSGSNQSGKKLGMCRVDIQAAESVT